MPLILAVEPDSRQASRLAAVLRGRRDTDVVMAKSAETALAAMDGRIPDVLLTSQLLSPQDEQRLAAWLKDLGPVAGHVQALTIPILATPEIKVEEPPRGLLSGLLRRAENPGAQGCEPQVFAEHVATYLEQRQVECIEMGNTAPEAVTSAEVVSDALIPEAVWPAPEAPGPAASPIEAAAAEDEGAWLLTQTLKVAPAIDKPAAVEVDTAPIVQLTPTYELPPEVVEEPPVTAHNEPQVLTMPRAVIPLQDLEVVFLPPEIVTVRDDGGASAPRPAPRRPGVPESTPVVAASDAPPVMDEWGLFDPSKCGFSALLDKLDAITEDERRSQSDADTHVRVVTHY